MQTTTTRTPEAPTTASDCAEVVEWCHRHDLPAELVGRWVWVKFGDKPSPEQRAAMKAAGFVWHSKRGEWFHRCGDRRKRRMSRAEPRELHGSIPVAELEVEG